MEADGMPDTEAHKAECKATHTSAMVAAYISGSRLLGESFGAGHTAMKAKKSSCRSASIQMCLYR